MQELTSWYCGVDFCVHGYEQQEGFIHIGSNFAWSGGRGGRGPVWGGDTGVDYASKLIA